MKNKKKIFGATLFLTALMSLSLVGCGNSSGGSSAPAPSLEVKDTEVTMEVYDTYQIRYSVKNTENEVLFEEYDTSIISVSSLGLVRGLKAGDTEIKISVKDTTLSVVLPVKVEFKEHLFDVDLPEAPTYQEDSLQIHYYRKDGKYKGWNLWLWEGGKDGAQFDFNGKDDWGVIASYPLSTWIDPLTNKLGFIVRKGNWESKDVESDRFVNFPAYEKDENGIYHIYLKLGDENIYLNKYGTMRGKIEMASFANMSRVAIRTNLRMLRYAVRRGEEVLIDTKLATPSNYENFALPNGEKVEFTKEYYAEVDLENGETLVSPISKNLLYKEAEFGELYNYDGELGAIYTKEKTTFKVWSPFSSSIKVKIYNTGTPAWLGGSDEPVQTLDMVKGERGVFSAEATGDLEGKYYTFVVTNSSFTNKEIVDPYARSCGINGSRGMIVDFSKTNPEGWDEVEYLPYDRKELTIYETHVADVTSSKTWTGTEANRKLFKGMFESGTTYTEGEVTVKTGFDHIKELGVNAVQIIPFFDQANDEVNMTFNWGYNPLNYNSLEGGYSSDPYDGYVRIREFKELVKAYNEAGIEIIMDVVYNHVAGANDSNFDVLVPGYYYRYDGSGNLTNGSGCGNETASENYMMRKFMVDSVKFWLSEYKLGGFRFDLMGLHDLETMAEVTREAKKINDHVTIFGEPWSGGTSPLKDSLSAKQINGNKYEGYGAFNDAMRDALIKGGLNAKTDLGWICGNPGEINKIIGGIKGTTSAAVAIEDPDKTVNYVTCHDNYTLYDRFIATGQFDPNGIDETDEEAMAAFEAARDARLAKMNVLANSIVFTSQGTSFMLAGEEFLRTKGGDHNSYMSSYEVNELDYSLKIKHLDMFESYKKLIALKQNLDGLHLAKEEASAIEVETNIGGLHISYKLRDTANNKEVWIIHSIAGSDEVAYDLSGYELYWSTTEGSKKVLNATTKIGYCETLIAIK